MGVRRGGGRGEGGFPGVTGCDERSLTVRRLAELHQEVSCGAGGGGMSEWYGYARVRRGGEGGDERSLTVRKLANLYQEVDGGGGREEGQLMGAREWMVWVRGCAHGGGGVPMGERV
jgi:hypothetical protein